MFVFKPILEFQDRAVWERLWYGYDPGESAEHTDYAWRRLHDRAGQVKGIIIFDKTHPIGFAHYIMSETTLGPKPDCYIKDLFISADHRGNGAGKATLEWFKEQARLLGWAKVTLKTRPDNHISQKLYDKVCERKDDYIHYDVLKLGQ